jgi:hypothetical protein
MFEPHINFVFLFGQVRLKGREPSFRFIPLCSHGKYGK